MLLALEASDKEVRFVCGFNEPVGYGWLVGLGEEEIIDAEDDIEFVNLLAEES